MYSQSGLAYWLEMLGVMVLAGQMQKTRRGYPQDWVDWVCLCSPSRLLLSSCTRTSQGVMFFLLSSSPHENLFSISIHTGTKGPKNSLECKSSLGAWGSHRDQILRLEDESTNNAPSKCLALVRHKCPGKVLSFWVLLSITQALFFWSSISRHEEIRK